MNRGASLLRLLAIVIAGLAVIDPAITSNRAVPPEVSIVASGSPRDSALAARVALQLGSSFQVTIASLPSADATVLIGSGLPTRASDLATPVFAVTPGDGGPTVSIESIRAPSPAPQDARVPVEARIRVTGARARTLSIALRAGGVVVDRTTLPVTSDDTLLTPVLAFAPTGVGAASLRLSASIVGAAADRSRDADIVVDVRDMKWSVLFFDPRPSWQSTFVRRAIEADPRFVVTSRVTTSKNISTDAGAPPSLDDAAGVARFDVVVIGAPDALNDREVAALDGYLRQRGGSVVVLLDQRGAGPYQRLLGTAALRDNGSGRVTVIKRINGSADSADLRASALAWPARLPEGASVLARSVPIKGDTTPAAPVIWQLAVGAGHLVVSGALDSWRYRDATVSAFDASWRTLIADAANAASPPIALHLPDAPLHPGEAADIAITLRDAALRPLPAQATVSAELQSTDGALRVPIRLWPTGSVGELTGTVRAPAVPGTYRVVVTSDLKRIEGAIVVSNGVSRTTPDDRELLTDWTRSRGGQVIAANALSRLPAALRSAIHPPAQPTRWHPMHSSWWLLPFVVALSLEWWWRRRRGLR